MAKITDLKDLIATLDLRGASALLVKGYQLAEALASIEWPIGTPELPIIVVEDFEDIKIRVKHNGRH